jgi:hypothetical protein
MAALLGGPVWGSAGVVMPESLGPWGLGDGGGERASGDWEAWTAAAVSRPGVSHGEDEDISVGSPRGAAPSAESPAPWGTGPFGSEEDVEMAMCDGDRLLYAFSPGLLEAGPEGPPAAVGGGARRGGGGALVAPRPRRAQMGSAPASLASGAARGDARSVCGLCGTEVWRSNYSKHARTAGHLAAAAAAGIEETPAEAAAREARARVHCDVCDAPVSRSNLSKHVRSVRHVRLAAAAAALRT